MTLNYGTYYPNVQVNYYLHKHMGYDRKYWHTKYKSIRKSLMHLPFLTLDFICLILLFTSSFISIWCTVFASELRTTCSKFTKVLTFQKHKWPKQIELVPRHHYPFPSYCHPWDVDNIFNMLPPSLIHPKLDVTSKEP